MAPPKTDAQIKAQREYMKKFVEVKVRMTPEKRDIVKGHADKHDGGSATAFINRAIDETMERDKEITPLTGDDLDRLCDLLLDD
ncbi:hypothetical protein LJC49_07330 [Ruminococcaceae bacterium OttesenSCG-928-I18]|nr:hypothetical protein [Ruminococcaceae bacterium OttesenSCG-928-I18]